VSFASFRSGPGGNGVERTQFHPSTRAFTLIELLAAIAVLSAIGQIIRIRINSWALSTGYDRSN